MTAATKYQFLIFSIADKKLAIALKNVDQVYSAVEIELLPSAPETVLGLINVHGTFIVVLNLRRKLNLPERSVELSDQMIVANVDDRQVAIVVDDVDGVVQLKEEQVSSDARFSNQTINLDADTIKILRFDNFLSESEQDQLNSALQEAFAET